MKRNLSNDIFSKCNDYLGEQAGYIGEMTQAINGALIGEYSSEFSNGFIKTRYSEISSLLLKKKNLNIEEMISLGRKNVSMSGLDSQGATALNVIASEVNMMLQEIKSMVNNVTTSVTTIRTTGLTADILLNNLPEERANEIRNGNIFVSMDGKYIYYNGYPYEVYNPTTDILSEDVVIMPTGSWDWKDVYCASYKNSEFDFLEFINGSTSNAGDNLDQDATVLYNAPMARYTFYQSLSDATTNVTIDVMFQENSNGDRRVIMGVNNSSYEDIYQNMNYSKPYSIFDNAGGVFSVAGGADSSREIYEKLTGNEAKITAYYDIQYTFDEKHRDEKYQSYLSFDGDGNLQETPTVYGGDKKELVERDGYLGEIGVGEKVYEFELLPTPQPVPDVYKDKITDAINGGF